MRGIHHPLDQTGPRGRFDADYRSSLPAQRRRLFAPLRALECATDVFAATQQSPNIQAMAAAYEAEAVEGRGTFELLVRPGDLPVSELQKDKVLAGLDAALASNQTYDAIIVWRFDIEPLRNVTAWVVTKTGRRRGDDADRSRAEAE